ncbi:MAG: VRR-NUC domain-containing protein [Pseudomonadales bacterium]
MIEIKGPGDRLQNHQIAWLEFLIAQGITASTLFITAEEPRSNECELS